MNTEQQIEDVTAAFTAPFSKENLKNDILDVMVILINQTRFTFNRNRDTEEKLWALLSKNPLENIYSMADPDMEPEELGLTFTDIGDIGMVEDLMEFYDYGVLGILDTSRPNFDDSEGSGNWTSRILYDLRRSSFFEDWSEYKSDRVKGAVERCLHVTELANARLILEGGREGFFLGQQANDALSIRQMSLLSGMTEASIRTLAGPNRKNRLITKKDGNNTVIEIEEAKSWLIAKGRYVHIKETSAKGEEDFTNHKFFSTDDFACAIDSRRSFLVAELGEDETNERIKKAGLVEEDIPLKNIPGTYKGISNEQFQNTDLMQRLAVALKLPPELFALRAAEVVAHEKLRAIVTLLKKLNARLSTDTTTGEML